jgi:hypothetical protein
MSLHPRRFTADIDGDFVVFLIGMRLKAIDAHPKLGRLGYQQWNEPVVEPY